MCEDLKRKEYKIKPQGGMYKVYHKGVVLADSPEESLADYIAKEYSYVDMRIAKSIEDLIERTEAQVKENLLNLNFGANDGFGTNG